MFGHKKKKSGKAPEYLFKKEAYIPKKRLHKTERRVPVPVGKKRHQLEAERERGFGRKLLVLTLWLVFWGEMIYVLFFGGFFTVNTIEINREGDSAFIQDEQIKSFLRERWQGRWYHVVPKNNLLLHRSFLEEAALLERYPKIESLEVRKLFPDTLRVTVTEKPYQLLWCQQETCFLVDKEGRAQEALVFFRYPEEQGSVVRIQESMDVNVQVGDRVLHPEDQRFVHDLITDFTLRTGLNREGSLERPNLYAREMRVRTDKGFTIFFNTTLPVAQSLNHLMLVLQKEIPEAEWDKIDYIDLRTEKRVYYTRKDRAPEKTEEQIKREEEAEKKRKEEEEKNRQQSAENRW